MGDDGWAALDAVGNQIVNQGSFDCRNYGFGKLSGLFYAFECFEVQVGSNGSGATLCSVRKPSKKDRGLRRGISFLLSSVEVLGSLGHGGRHV